MLCINVRIFEQFQEALNPNIAFDFPTWLQIYVSID